MREDDVAAQVRLVDRVVSSRRYQGLVIAPTQALVPHYPCPPRPCSGHSHSDIHSPLALPAGGDLSYILNDEEEGGRLAARRVAHLLNGKGTCGSPGHQSRRHWDHNPCALVRTNPYGGIPRNSDCGEAEWIVQRVARTPEGRRGSPTESRTIDACVALMWTTLDGLFSALDSMHPRSINQNRGFRYCRGPAVPTKTGTRLRDPGRHQADGATSYREPFMLTVPANPCRHSHLKPRLITRENLNRRKSLPCFPSTGAWGGGPGAPRHEAQPLGHVDRDRHCGGIDRLERGMAVVRG